VVLPELLAPWMKANSPDDISKLMSVRAVI